MQVGDKVIITGGTAVNWGADNKPHYVMGLLDNEVTKAYREKEVCTVNAWRESTEHEAEIDILNPEGIRLSSFYAWELQVVTQQ